MSSHPIPTIRSTLLWLVTACVLPASLMAVALVAYNYQRERAELLRDATATARAMSSALERELSSAQAALYALGSSPYLDSEVALPNFHTQARLALSQQNFTTIVLIDPSGQQRINTFKPFGTVLPVTKTTSVMLQVFRTGRPATSNQFTGPVTGTSMVAVGVPVRRQGKIVFSLAAGIESERLAPILTQQGLPPGWIGLILDSEGTIVARSANAEHYTTERDSPELVPEIARQAEGTIEVRSPDSGAAVVAYSRSTISNWTVAIAIPRSTLSDALLRSFWWILIGSLLLLGASLALAARIGARVADSITRLQAPALALGTGKLVVVPPIAIREAHEVGQALALASQLLMRTQHLAMHDTLTGLANRALFDEILAQQVEMCKRTGSHVALLFIDLDGFKAVNDLHGHQQGDALLQAVALRLADEVRASDVIARFGGDEFALILAHTGVEAASQVADKLVDALSLPYRLGMLAVEVSVSIGVAVYPASGLDAAGLLRRADEMLYASKNAGKRRYTVAA